MIFYATNKSQFVSWSENRQYIFYILLKKKIWNFSNYKREQRLKNLKI